MFHDCREPDAVTDSHGTFTLDSIDTGTYCIEVVDNRKHGVLLTCKVKADDSIVVLPSNILKPFGSIQGSIVVNEGKTKSNALIVAKGIERICSTDSNGVFTLENVPYGNYQLEVQPRMSGYSTTTINAGKVDAGTTKDIGKIPLIPADTLLQVESTFFRTELQFASGPFQGCGADAIGNNLKHTEFILPHNTYAGSPLLLAETSFGMVVSWTLFNSEHIHLTPLDMEGNRHADDIIIPGKTAVGLSTDSYGYCLLVIDSKDVISLVRVNWKGIVTIKRVILDPQHNKEGIKPSREANVNKVYRCGNGYAVYFGLNKDGTAYSDQLRFFHQSGIPCQGGWQTGCRNSFQGGRLAFNGNYMAALCFRYNGADGGIYYGIGSTPLISCPSNELFYFEGEFYDMPKMGGLVPAADGGFWFLYSTDKVNADIILAHLKTDGSVRKRQLTISPSVEEAYPRMSRFADGYVASWVVGSNMVFARFDRDGNEIGDRERYSFSATSGFYTNLYWSDMVYFSNGDVGWVYKAGADAFNISRISACR